LETFIRIFAENSGLASNKVLAKLHSAHHEGRTTEGVNVNDEEECLCDAKQLGILDTYSGKSWGLQYATNAARTILLVDQIIMAKRAGGPKARAAQGDQDDD